MNPDEFRLRAEAGEIPTIDPKLQTAARSGNKYAVREMERQMAAQQRDIATQQERAAREQEQAAEAAMKEQAREQERQRARDVRAMAAAGAEIETDIETGKRSVKTHEDGTPVAKAGPIGDPQILTVQPQGPMPGTGAPQQPVTRVNQTYRDDRWNEVTESVPPKTDPQTGEQYVETKDAYGRDVRTVTGVDPDAQKKLALETESAQLDLAKNNIAAQKLQNEERWKSVQAEWKAAEAEWGKPPKYKQQNGKWVDADGFPVEPKALSDHMAHQAGVKAKYEAAKRRHDEIAPVIRNIEEQERKIALRKFEIDSERTRIEHGLPSAASTTAQSATAETTGELTPEQKEIADILSTVPGFGALMTLPDQPETPEDAAPVPLFPADDEGKRALVASAFQGIIGADQFTIGKSGDGYTFLQREGQNIASLDKDADTGEPVIVLNDNLTQNADLRQIIAFGGTGGTPIYLREGSGTRSQRKENAFVTGVFQAFKDDPTLAEDADRARVVLSAMGADPATIQRRVNAGDLSVQRGEELMQGIYGSTLKADDPLQPATFDRWMTESAPRETRDAWVVAKGTRDTAGMNDIKRQYLNEWFVTNRSRPGITMESRRLAEKALMGEARTGEKAEAFGAEIAQGGGSMLGLLGAPFMLAQLRTLSLLGDQDAAAAEGEIWQNMGRGSKNVWRGFEGNRERLATAEGKARMSRLAEARSGLRTTINTQDAYPDGIGNPEWKAAYKAAIDTHVDAMLAVHDLNQEAGWNVTRDDIDPAKNPQLASLVNGAALTGDMTMLDAYFEAVFQDHGTRQARAYQAELTAGASPFMAGIIGGATAPPEEIGIEIVTSIATGLLGKAVFGGAKAATLANAAGDAAGAAVRVNRFRKLALGVMDDYKKLGMVEDSLAKPAGKFGKAQNAVTKAAKVAVPSALSEGPLEEGTMALADPNLTPESWAKDSFMGAVLGVIAAPVLAGPAVLAQNSKEAYQRAQVAGNYAAKYNRAMANTPGFRALSAKDAETVMSLMDPARKEQAIQNARDAAGKLIQAVEAASGPNPAPEAVEALSRAQEASLKAQNDLALLVADPTEAVTSLQSVPAAKRDFARAVLKVASGHPELLTPQERSAAAGAVTADGQPYFANLGGVDAITDAGRVDALRSMPQIGKLIRTTDSQILAEREFAAAAEEPAPEVSTEATTAGLEGPNVTRLPVSPETTTRARAITQRVFDAVRAKSPAIAARMKARPAYGDRVSGGVMMNADTIEIIPDDIAQLIEQFPDSTDEQIVAKLEDDITLHEITHVAQIEQAAAEGKAKGYTGSDAKIAERVFAERHAQMTPAMLEIGKELYARNQGAGEEFRNWTTLQPWMQAAEIERMFVEAVLEGRTTDANRFLTTATKPLRDYLLRLAERIVEAIRSGVASFTTADGRTVELQVSDELKARAEQIAETVRQLKANAPTDQNANPTDSGNRPSQPAPGQTGDETGAPAQADGNSTATDDGGTDEAPVDDAGAPDESGRIEAAKELLSLVATVGGKSWGLGPNDGPFDDERPFVFIKVGKGVLPFYRSSKGTSGKQKGGWSPFFGVGSHKGGDWIIKGTSEDIADGYGDYDIARIQQLLNTTTKGKSALWAEEFLRANLGDERGKIGIRQASQLLFGKPQFENVTPYVGFKEHRTEIFNRLFDYYKAPAQALTEHRKAALQVAREAFRKAFSSRPILKKAPDVVQMLEDVAYDIAEQIESLSPARQFNAATNAINSFLESEEIATRIAELHAAEEARVQEYRRAARARVEQAADEAISRLKVIQAMDRNGIRINLPPSILKLMEKRRKDGARLTQNEIETLEKFKGGEWNGVPRKADWVGDKRRAILQAIVGRITAPYGDGQNPDDAAKALEDPNALNDPITVDEMLQAIGRELDSVSKSNNAALDNLDDPDAELTDEQAEKALVGLEERRTVQKWKDASGFHHTLSKGDALRMEAEYERIVAEEFGGYEPEPADADAIVQRIVDAYKARNKKPDAPGKPAAKPQVSNDTESPVDDDGSVFAAIERGNRLKTIPSAQTTSRIAPWLSAIPGFQGHKQEMLGPTTEAIWSAMSPGQRAHYTVGVDYFGGGGSWAIVNALISFPNLREMVVYEKNPLRLKKIQLFHEKGNMLGEVFKNPSVAKILSEAANLADQSGNTSGSAIADRISFSGVSDTVAIGALKAIQDYCKNSFGTKADASGNKTPQAKLEMAIRIVTEEARASYQAANAFRRRGGKIQYRNADSYEADPIQGDHVMAFADPPYFLTKGYEQVNTTTDMLGQDVVEIIDEGVIGEDTYAKTRDLLDRLAQAGNGFIYTDSAWWRSTPKDQIAKGQRPTPAYFSLSPDMRAVFHPQGKAILGDIARLADRFDVVAGKIGLDRKEVLGIHYGNQINTDTGRGSRPERLAWDNEAGGSADRRDDQQSGGGNPAAQAMGGMAEGTPGEAGPLRSGTGDPIDPDIEDDLRQMGLMSPAPARIRRSIGELQELAKSQEDFRFWFQDFRGFLEDFLGPNKEYAPLVSEFLNATSAASTVGSNVVSMMKALREYIQTGTFVSDFLPAHLGNLHRAESGQTLSGPKISEYSDAIFGIESAVPVDRHIAQLLYNTDKPTAAQIEAAKIRVAKVGLRLGWTPRQTMATLWAANIARNGRTPQSYERYLQKHRFEIRRLLTADREGNQRGLKAARRIAQRIEQRRGDARNADGLPAGNEGLSKTALFSPAAAPLRPLTPETVFDEWGSSLKEDGILIGYRGEMTPADSIKPTYMDSPASVWRSMSGMEEQADVLYVLSLIEKNGWTAERALAHAKDDIESELDPKEFFIPDKNASAEDNGFGSSEGVGLYLAKDGGTSSFFGKTRMVNFPQPKRPLIVDEDGGAETIPLLNEDAEAHWKRIFSHKTRPGDSDWMKAHILAAKQIGLTEDTWVEKIDSYPRALTDILLQMGYDAVYVRSGGMEWVNLLAKPGQRFNRGTRTEQGTALYSPAASPFALASTQNTPINERLKPSTLYVQYNDWSGSSPKMTTKAVPLGKLSPQEAFKKFHASNNVGSHIAFSTDANGTPETAVSIASTAPVYSPEGQYMLGDIDAFKKDRARRISQGEDSDGAFVEQVADDLKYALKPPTPDAVDEYIEALAFRMESRSPSDIDSRYSSMSDLISQKRRYVESPPTDRNSDIAKAKSYVGSIVGTEARAKADAMIAKAEEFAAERERMLKSAKKPKGQKPVRTNLKPGQKIKFRIWDAFDKDGAFISAHDHGYIGGPRAVIEFYGSRRTVYLSDIAEHQATKQDADGQMRLFSPAAHRPLEEQYLTTVRKENIDGDVESILMNVMEQSYAKKLDESDDKIRQLIQDDVDRYYAEGDDEALVPDSDGNPAFWEPGPAKAELYERVLQSNAAVASLRKLALAQLESDDPGPAYDLAWRAVESAMLVPRRAKPAGTLFSAAPSNPAAEYRYLKDKQEKSGLTPAENEALLRAEKAMGQSFAIDMDDPNLRTRSKGSVSPAFQPSLNLERQHPITGQQLALFSPAASPRLTDAQYARHAELEAKHNAGTITPEEIAEAERIVEQAAKANGYNVIAYRGDKTPIEKFDKTKIQAPSGGVFSFAARRSYSENFGTVQRYALKAQNPATAEQWSASIRGKMKDPIASNKALIDAGYDSVHTIDPEEAENEVWGVLDPQQIKSADPFTGTPLSERFNPESDSILMSPAPAPFQKAVEDALKTLAPIYREVFKASQASPAPTPQELADRFGVSARAIENILGAVRARLRAVSEAATGDLKPNPADTGRPDLGYSTVPALQRVDQLRNQEQLPNGATLDEIRKAGEAFLRQPNAVQRLIEADGEWNATETAAANIALVNSALRNEVTEQTALLAEIYREQGSRWSEAGRARRDVEMSPAERSALLIHGLLVDPDARTSKALKKAKTAEEKRSILAAWTARVTGIKQSLKDRGIDVEAAMSRLNEQVADAKSSEAEASERHQMLVKALQDRVAELELAANQANARAKSAAGAAQQAQAEAEAARAAAALQKAQEATKQAEALDPANTIKLELRKLSTPRRMVVETMRNGGTWQQAAEATGMTVEEARKVMIDFIGALKKAAADAILLAEDMMLGNQALGAPSPLNAAAPEGKKERAAKIADAMVAAAGYDMAMFDRRSSGKPATATSKKGTGTKAKTDRPDPAMMSDEEFARRQNSPDTHRALWQWEMTVTRPQNRISFEDWMAKPQTKARLARQQRMFAQPVSTTTGTLDMHDPNSVRAAAREVAATRASIFDKVVDYWRMAILTGPQTAIVNTASNVMHSLYHLGPRRLVEAGLNDVLGLFGAGDKNSATLGEIAAMTRVIHRALAMAGQNMVKSWNQESRIAESMFTQAYQQHELGQLKGEDLTPALRGPLGTIMRSLSYRHMTAADEFIKAFHGTMEAAAQAHRIAKREKLTGKAYAARIEELMEFGSEAWRRALEVSEDITFQRKLDPKDPRTLAALDKLGSAIKRGTAKYRALAFFFPFVNTPTNIFKAAIEMSPIGALLAAIDGTRALKIRYASGKMDKRAAEVAASELYDRARLVKDLTNQIIAAGIFWALSGMVESDDDDESGLPRITGTVDWKATRKGERDNQYRTMPPMSIRLGDNTIVSYSRVEPFATMLAGVVDLIHEMNVSGGVNDKLLGAYFGRIQNQLTDKTFLAGVSDLVKAAQDPERFTTKLAGGIVTGFVPNLIRQPIREVDPVLRDVSTREEDGFFTAIAKQLGYSLAPGYAPPQVDVWGNPVTRHHGEQLGTPQTDILVRVFDPSNIAIGKEIDPIDLYIFNWNAKTDLKRHLALEPIRDSLIATRSGQPIKLPLTPEEQAEANRRAGQAAREFLGNEWDWKNPTEQGIERIKEVVRRYQNAERYRLRAQKLRAMQ